MFDRDQGLKSLDEVDIKGRTCKNGPLSDANRKCTDVWCCCVWLATSVAMI